MTGYARGCCTFHTFLEGFIASARRNSVPLLLIDRCLARRHWRTGLTGHEALTTQRTRLLKEAYYAGGNSQ